MPTGECRTTRHIPQGYPQREPPQIVQTSHLQIRIYTVDLTCLSKSSLPHCRRVHNCKITTPWIRVPGGIPALQSGSLAEIPNFEMWVFPSCADPVVLVKAEAEDSHRILRRYQSLSSFLCIYSVFPVFLPQSLFFPPVGFGCRVPLHSQCNGSLEICRWDTNGVRPGGS